MHLIQFFQDWLQCYIQVLILSCLCSFSLLYLGFQTSVCRMPHEKTRKSLLSNTCHFSLDRRRALTLSPEIKRDSCQVCPCMKLHDIWNSGVYCVSMFLHKKTYFNVSQTESPLKIPRRLSTAEDERVDTEMSKDRNKSHSRVTMMWTYRLCIY